MLTRFNLFIIAFAFVMGIVVFLTQTRSLMVAKHVDSQDLRNGAVNSVFNTGLLPESNDIEEQVAPNDDVLNMYRGRGPAMFSPEDTSIIDPVLELNEVSAFYISNPEYSDIRHSIIKKNPPIPVATNVAV